MVKWCGSCLMGLCCFTSKTYQPLSTHQRNGSFKGPRSDRDGNRTPRDQTRKLSIRYDVVRPVRTRESDNTTAHCHLPGTLRSPLSHCNNNCNYPSSQGHNHDRTPPRCTPPRTIHPTALSHGCALHSRLDQPVTSSTPGMDEKKVVQAAPSASPGQHVRTKSVLDGSGVVASISGARRRSGPQGLRSPAAKRPLSAPVALQGWLHKQGSEGLMLWKKRWFVLSEYCLFYYKGPEEEKLLGSILLPSYCVTVCKPEDKINKKFAFKAEHANMRTYHFAADTREIMNQWVNALTLATLLQDPNPGGGGGGGGGEALAVQEIAGAADGEHSARPSVSSISSILNHSADDSDSGFHGFQSRDDPTQSNNNSSPNSINTASFPNLSASNSNHLIANNNNINSNNNNNNAETEMEDGQPQPLMNGWMQPPPQFSQPSTSQQQYGHVMQNSIQSQQHQQQLHSQHQALMQQHMARQQHQHLMQQQQMQQPSTSNVQSVQPMPRNFGQPVYANAPPKPRRLTDGSIDYSTPSPDPEYRQSPVQLSAGIRMTAKSPIGEYDRGNVIYASRLAQQSIPPPLRTDKSGLNYGYSQGQPAAERRTPDTYGRSAKPRIPRTNGDYEDVYSGPQLYQRPPGPVGYTKGAAPNPISIPIYVQHGQTNQQQVCPVVIAPNPPIMRQPRAQPPPRPHSADFLEYEATGSPIGQTECLSGSDLNKNRRPQRPKSSLDVVGTSEVVSPNGDGYFYSEERYAAQMRQSAVYLHQTPQHHQQQRNQSLSRATTPSKSISRVDDLNNSISSAETPCSSNRRSPRDAPVYRQHPIATQSLQRYTESSTNEAMIRRSLRERSYDPAFRDSLIHDEAGTIPRRVPRDYETSSMTPRGNLGPHMAHSYHAGHPSGRRSNDQQFARSASARLPRTRHPNAPEHSDENEYGERTPGQNSRDGERRIQQVTDSRDLSSTTDFLIHRIPQREESMKRLLEWKQRMLQSPLTRKPSGPANGNATAQSELSSYYKRQALLDLAAHEASVAEARHSRRRDDSHRPHTRSKSSDGRRSVANVSRYNSYSSDDEEPGDVRRKRTRRPSHTGRSPRQISEENAETSPGHDHNNSKGRNIAHQDHQSNASHRSTIHGGIPPDAGYEEVSFPSMDDPIVHPSVDSINETLTAKTPKKPGILKTPSSYPNKQGTKSEATRLNTLAGFLPGETWQTTKNVQWDSTEDKENWDSKIDESRVIKEFSYQYIKADDIDDENNTSRESINLVQSRIRSFESSIDETTSPVKEMLSMQEPLKVSPSQATEAHVSRVDSSRKVTSNIREFALGDGLSIEDSNKNIDVKCEEKQNDGSKSVKDLLADFERKSQQVRRQESSKREEVKHRGVFSDTETLLYDTGSDLDQPDKSEEEIDERKKYMDKRQVHMSAHERNTFDIKEKTMISMGSLNDSQETIEATSADGAPDAFARLSMTESMVTHGDNLSSEETESPISKIDEINPEEHYLPMSPRKAILDPNNDDRAESKMMESLFANLHEECSYVEMTQNGIGHSLLAPNEDGKLDSGDYSALEASHYELVCVAGNKVEPVYMEVSQLADKEENKNIDTRNMQTKNSSSANNQTQIRLDLPDILTALKSDSSDADDESSKDLDSIDAPRHPRFSLSDTFRPASYYLGASRTLITELHDSSDSELVSPPPIPTSPPPMEDLDSLDMQEIMETKKCSPQVPVNRDSSRSSPMSWNKTAGQVETPRPPSRYSEATISSTFRESRISLESASGSDSLELRNPEEEARHRRMRRRPVSDEVCEVLDSLDELESLGSRFDGASIDLDQYLEELQARDAFNVDLYAKDLSYNSIYGFNENMLVADKIQKTTSHEMSKISLNPNALDQPFRYNSRIKTSSVSSLPSIRVSDTPPSHQHSQSFTGDTHYENVANFSPLRGSPAIRTENEHIKEEMRCQKIRGQRQISHSRDSSYSIPSVGGSNSMSANLQRPSSALSASISSPMGSIGLASHVNSYVAHNQSSCSDPRTRNHSRSASQDSASYSLSPNHRSTSSQDSSHPPPTSTVKLTQQIGRNSSGTSYAHSNNQNSEQTHDSDQNGAPYYYSDLQTGVSGIDNHQFRPSQTLIAHTSRLPQLNNQRGDSTGLNKRNDIGRLVNPITRQIPRRIEVEDIDEARRIAAELRKSSSQFLANTKSGLVDKRNFYEADTLRRVKSTDPTVQSPLPDVSTVNLYPHGLRDKSGSQTHLANDEVAQQTPQSMVQPSHRRSRSLEGLLDDVGLENFVEQRNRANRVSSVPPTMTQAPDDESTSTTFTRINSQEPFVSEDPWEQDTLWRESLRRVSLRHARSLDNLDTPEHVNETSADSRTRPKITRGATYVNDSVVLQRLASPDHVQERPRLKRRTEMENNDVNHEDDGTYESLAMDRASGGYVWNTDNESYQLQQSQQDSTNHFLDEGNLPLAHQQSEPRSFELDREKLRQWDLLSSACLLQEQQRNSMAESGRGLPRERRDMNDGQQDDISTLTMMRMMEEQTMAVELKEARARDKMESECVSRNETVEEMKTTVEKANGRASGSGSIIGRDPLPPRAVSTSQLAAQNPLTQPPVVISTLPHARVNGRERQHISTGQPIHQSTPQSNTSRNNLSVVNDNDSSIGRAASINDVQASSTILNNETSSESSQRLVSPSRNLRVISPIDHRVSSPSDSERHIHNSNERNMAASPISMRDMSGDNGSLRQMHRTSTIPKQKSVTSELESRAGSTTTGSSSRLAQVSAGELLGRTHEELVLLLIQLRRQSAVICKAMETCHMEIEAQARLADLDAPRRLENLQKLEELKKHLMNLEKQYEKGKPLVNLVDNMVKLGSLYNRNGVNGSVAGSRHDLIQTQENSREHRDRLEFNQRVQEQRLLAEERRDWERLSPDHGQLQAKVQQLYKLDRLLQEESGTLHSLQQDKEILEKALGGLRHKLQGSRSNPVETERYRKQQILLERELSRVRMLLAHNSKKLEETVAENARLEQDLVVLRQKLQASRRYTGNITKDSSGTTAALEAELRRVQQLVGDLQRQRQELSIQVRQLTEKSHSLVQQIKPNDPPTVLPVAQVHQSKKRTQSSWLETDLDSGMTFDHGLASPSSSSSSMSPRIRQNGSPHQHIPLPQYKDPPSHRYSPTQSSRQAQSNNQPIYVQAHSRSAGDNVQSHNHISALSPQLRAQIQQHQLKQQLLKDQMQGKASPVQSNVPLYVNTDLRRINCNDGIKRMDSSMTNGGSILPPEYVPPPPPPPSDETLLMNGNYGQHDDNNKMPGSMHNREKQEIKTVRIVKRESERRQRDRGDRSGNIGIPLTNGIQSPGGAKRIGDEEFGTQQFEKPQLDRVVEETPMIHAQSTVQLSELDDIQFQRSMSLPRGFGGQRLQPGIHNGPVPPPPRSDSMNALRNMMARRHRARFENPEGSSDSTLSLYTGSPTSGSQIQMSSPNYSTSPPYSPSNQNYISPYSRAINQSISPQCHANGSSQYLPIHPGSLSSDRTESLASPMSPALISPVPNQYRERLTGSVASINSLKESPQLSPVFKSEAAKQIIKEMTAEKTDSPRRRPVPKEKRRHYTVSSSKPMLDLEDNFSKMEMGRARDDLDMERALRPRINAPDVVRSTLSHKELKYNESTIDQLLGTPNKIVIPERYIPEYTPELSAEEKKLRLKKADAIRKMLSETTVAARDDDEDIVDVERTNSLKKKVAAEKRQRDHILQLNQILAKQVMEKSKMVAVKALATLPLNSEPSLDDDDLSPGTPLPLYQQRENFYS